MELEWTTMALIAQAMIIAVGCFIIKEMRRHQIAINEIKKLELEIMEHRLEISERQTNIVRAERDIAKNEREIAQIQISRLQLQREIAECKAELQELEELDHAEPAQRWDEI